MLLFLYKFKILIYRLRSNLIVLCITFLSKLFHLHPRVKISGLSRNYIYLQFLSDFKMNVPKQMKKHREYFSRGGRGFGEDAFHAVWFRLFQIAKPVNCLEIGVYRGQTISLWALLGKSFGYGVNVWGISPLSEVGDRHSSYAKLDYAKEIHSNFEHFQLTQPTLIKALSSDHTAVTKIRDTIWDLVYIDGSHDYDVAKEDYENAKIGLKSGGYLVLDDSSLNTKYCPQVKNSTKGWPGPSRVFDEISPLDFEFVIGVGHLNLLQRI
jgi:hypothetical protein